MAHILLFLSITLSFPISHVCIENVCQSFLCIGTRSLELGIHIDDKLWYGVIENQAHCSSILPLIFPFFCLF